MDRKVYRLAVRVQVVHAGYFEAKTPDFAAVIYMQSLLKE